MVQIQRLAEEEDVDGCDVAADRSLWKQTVICGLTPQLLVTANRGDSTQTCSKNSALERGNFGWQPNQANHKKINFKI